MTKKRIYFDYAAATPVAPEVFEAMEPYFLGKYGNPGSLHSFGQEAMAAVDKSRETIAKAIGADFREIIFTGSATEANNLALAKLSFPSARHTASRGDQADAPAGYSRETATRATKPARIIVSAIEHESILETAREKENVEVVVLPVNREGFVDLGELKGALNDNTVLVSIMYANNEIGTIQPIQEIAEIIKSYKTNKTNWTYPLLHTDAVQAFQFLDCNVKKLGMDLMTLSAHKIYGPKGIGALYIKPISPIGPIGPIVTGGGQEFGLRSGTENTASIVGFAKAVELVSDLREKESKRIRNLRDYLWQGLKKISSKVERNGGEPALPNILNVYFPNQNSQDLLIKFDIAGLAVSSGSACSARSSKPSSVLRALGYPLERVKASIRFSFGRFTTTSEINEALQRIRRLLK